MISKLMKNILPYGNPIETKVFILQDIRDDVLTNLYKRTYGDKCGYELFLEHASLYDETNIDELQFNYRTFQPYIDILLENKIKINKTLVYPELKLYTEYNFFEDYDLFDSSYSYVNVNYNKIYTDILFKMFDKDLYIEELSMYKNVYKRVKEIENYNPHWF